MPFSAANLCGCPRLCLSVHWVYPLGYAVKM